MNPWESFLCGLLGPTGLVIIALLVRYFIKKKIDDSKFYHFYSGIIKVRKCKSCGEIYNRYQRKNENISFYIWVQQSHPSKKEDCHCHKIMEDL